VRVAPIFVASVACARLYGAGARGQISSQTHGGLVEGTVTTGAGIGGPISNDDDRIFAFDLVAQGSLGADTGGRATGGQQLGMMFLWGKPMAWRGMITGGARETVDKIVTGEVRFEFGIIDRLTRSKYEGSSSHPEGGVAETYLGVNVFVGTDTASDAGGFFAGLALTFEYHLADYWHL
jgi:hypothetical protein